MAGGLTRKYDYEKSKRQANAQKPEYREGIQEQGDNFDRGGTRSPKLLAFRGQTVVLNPMPLYAEDKLSLVRTLERNWRFVIGGQVGTVCRLLKNSKVAGPVRDRFAMTRQSILCAEHIVGTAKHPKKNREFFVVEFKCFLEPADPFPDPIFKDHLAFAAKIVGPGKTVP